MAELPPALFHALDLLHVPSRVQNARRQPLPEETSMLLRIVAGDDDAIAAAVAISERDEVTIVEAATFFVMQVLLDPDSDSYRVLGATPDMEIREIRQHMAWLLRWLHPDAQEGLQSVFATRVTRAWEDVKTPERRATHDAERQQLLANLPGPAEQGVQAMHFAPPPHAARLRQMQMQMQPPRHIRLRQRQPSLVHRFVEYLIGRGRN